MAGMLIAIRDTATAFFDLTVIYLVSAIGTLRLPNKQGVSAGEGSALHQIIDGYRYIRRTLVLFWLLVM